MIELISSMRPFNYCAKHIALRLHTPPPLHEDMWYFALHLFISENVALWPTDPTEPLRLTTESLGNAQIPTYTQRTQHRPRMHQPDNWTSVECYGESVHTITQPNIWWQVHLRYLVALLMMRIMRRRQPVAFSHFSRYVFSRIFHSALAVGFLRAS